MGSLSVAGLTASSGLHGSSKGVQDLANAACISPHLAVGLAHVASEGQLLVGATLPVVFFPRFILECMCVDWVVHGNTHTNIAEYATLSPFYFVAWLWISLYQGCRPIAQRIACRELTAGSGTLWHFDLRCLLAVKRP